MDTACVSGENRENKQEAKQKILGKKIVCTVTKQKHITLQQQIPCHLPPQKSPGYCTSRYSNVNDRETQVCTAFRFSGRVLVCDTALKQRVNKRVMFH